jgi:beta-alanine degradation protein BauB
VEGTTAYGEERGTFDVAGYADELGAASGNRQLGTALWLENEHVRVFEVRLEPGERGPFHIHDGTYFWTVVEPGRGLQRFVDGTYVARDYALGETRYLVHTAEDPLVHDLENIGDSTLRFVTVELKH